MNEQELKELWKSDEPIDLRNVNFEKIQENVTAWQGKLRRKIKLDIFINILGYVLLIPVFYILPKLLYLSPIFAVIWIWYLWELWRIYKLETKSFGFEDTRLHLEEKKTYLENYILRTRLILYVSTPFIIFVTVWIFSGLKTIFENPTNLIIGIILLGIVSVIIGEIYVRLIYSPSVKKLKGLLAQLTSEE